MQPFEEPCAVEIANIAIVRKGGSKQPTGADGRGLRELLIEKEYVSWNDPLQCRGHTAARERDLSSVRE